MSLFQCLHKLVVVRVNVIVFAVVDTLWFLLALEHVEERLTGDRLDNDTLLTSLFVLLCLFRLFLGHILTLVPLDLSTDDLNRLVRVIVSDSNELEWLRVSEVLIF